MLFNFDIKKIKEGLTKTRKALFNKITESITQKAVIDEKTFEDLENVLLASDLGLSLVDKILISARQRLVGVKDRSFPVLLEIIKEELKSVLNSVSAPDDFPAGSKGPGIFLIVGTNGAGKTTTLGKLAYQFKSAGKSVIIGSADTYRAAANEQLKIWAERASVKIVESAQAQDPGAVTYDTIQTAIREKTDVVLIDTAGRLHNNKNLMSELSKVGNVITALLPDASKEIFLVLDGNLGQNALKQLEEFNKILHITGLIVTKLDGTARGGSIIQLAYEYKIPIRFIGIGEGIDDLQLFNASAFIDSLFDDD